ncbi:uncharacterized protein MYCFIDRAFT_173667 [Pseudocercospora fijiensis CIRAD86]|uniref:Uncharacterized protein n=1 Tax=Pseudocercospora fijiensis (strain CIRAD86) TaxID=383855 RepID=M3AJI9_PSEFD|nr:uncharacterized protein MYCFIDRAFT_173667 [Pseudocercospora fijiensis CIRAD86]EME84731.1 hypothetical protein MYCFIDRAFT_173667 [Pseudocercospora fijiensis CIRAD86]
MAFITPKATCFKHLHRSSTYFLIEHNAGNADMGSGDQEAFCQAVNRSRSSKLEAPHPDLEIGDSLSCTATPGIKPEEENAVSELARAAHVRQVRRLTRWDITSPESFDEQLPES